MNSARAEAVLPAAPAPSLFPLAFPTFLVLVSLHVGDGLAGLAFLVLWAIWRVLPAPYGPRVLAIALLFQWLEVAAGPLYVWLTRRTLPLLSTVDYRPMMLLGLVALLALAVGLRAGMRLASGSEVERGRDSLPLRPSTLVLLYLSSLFLSDVLARFAWSLPQLNQAFVALTYWHLGASYLLFREWLRPPARWKLVLPVFAFEIALGFSGYFASFLGPLTVFCLAFFEHRDWKRKSEWVRAVPLVTCGAFLCLFWLSVRADFRKAMDYGFLGASRSERLGYFASLGEQWLRSDFSSFLYDLDYFVHRLSITLSYQSLAYHRVPEVVPHERGGILAGALRHVAMPRMFFPEKPFLPSESEKVRKYSGVEVASEKQKTNIALGYVGEAYVDFGIPLMFVPIFLYGCAMGAAYGGLLRAFVHRDLGVGLVGAVFWLSLWQYERSWVKVLGFVGTLLFYVSATGLLVDRLVAVLGKRDSTAP